MIYYLLAILNNINIIVGLTLGISFIFSLMLILGYFIDAMDERLKNSIKISLIIFIISSFLFMFIPSQKQAAFIIIAPAIVENEDLQDTLKNIPEIAKLGTEYIKEMLKKGD